MDKKEFQSRLFCKVPEEYEVVVTYTWANISHGKVSGHIFEVIDYYLFLRRFFKVCIFIGDNKSYEDIITLVLDKYKENTVLEDIFFHNNPKILDASKQTVIVTDGAASYIFDRGGVVLYKNLIVFRCGGVPSFKSLESRKNVYLLQDNRVYLDKPNLPVLDYKKKILFSALKDKTEQGTSAFLYITKNCRDYSIEEVKNSYNFESYLVCTGTPVPNLINRIHTYIYTPVFCKGTVQYKLDCSPRLIAECAYYNIDVLYHNIDYEDKGLEARRHDIEHEFDSLRLEDSDYLVTFLRDLL